MPISWNEIKTRATVFSKDWENESRENAEAKSFWDAFFNVFGITRRRIATFEEPVKKSDGKGGFIDLLWRGQLLVEHKSLGKDLDRAFEQAKDYFPGISERDLPKYILVSDFAKFRLYNLDTKEQFEFGIKELYQNIKLFGFIAGYQTRSIKPQDYINIKAAEQMGKLHDELKSIGYVGHSLELYLVRLLFCLFAEDTTIFEKRLFQDYIETKTNEDGSDLAHHLNSLFYILNTPNEKRLRNLDESLASFPYVNGKLFEEVLPPAQFDLKMREALLDLCALDWSIISPAIFGSLFQSIMDGKARRNLGAHYTSEENILKVIKPLFLDNLWVEFEKIKAHKNRLFEFHKNLRSLTFFDPACGCGNFLVITYRELRFLELAVLRAFNKLTISSGRQMLAITESVDEWITLNVDQFYGIEIEEFPAQIAQVALWLTDHQMNMRISEEFGSYYARIPIKASPHIKCANALTLDWESFLPPNHCNFLLGNPPFVGAKLMDDAQRADAKKVFYGIKNEGLLDFVAAWYVKATKFIQLNPNIKCAFVSTNSITQGEQVGVLWGWMLSQKIKIQFAHRTFNWTNEAKGKAAVHCVIIGFSLKDSTVKTIFDYADIKGEPIAVSARNINPYLVDAPDLVLPRRSTPISEVPKIGIGNKPIDGGYYLFTENEKKIFIKKEPSAEHLFRRWIGADEFLKGNIRWCLWVGGSSPETLRKMPLVMERIDLVKQFRLGKIPNKKGKPIKKAPPISTQNLVPTKFHVEFIPEKSFMVIPEVSSERRKYIPLGYLEPNILASNKLRLLPFATPYDFGVLSSNMHMAWTRQTCGRMKSDYQYSINIVYNNFPWPEKNEKFARTIELAAMEILKARKEHPNSSLADLYDPLTMPSSLLKAHIALDKAVDKAYLYKSAITDTSRVAFLFGLYEKQIGMFQSKIKKRKSI